ncbi:AraC family transcriptional regulator [Nocardia altamirensis]|uniref:AraC family transcriptional regulator n=1 Tax=Nocardia altamirensis TaxID=472158 RepID=UPI000AC423AA|nr:helix-turn-helix domain-containing protein [Nocardia altamirensis]
MISLRAPSPADSVGLPRQAPVVTADLVAATVPAPESLRPWLTELDYVPTVRDRIEPFAHLPQAATTLVLRLPDAGPRDALVIGPQTQAIYSKASKPTGCIRMRLSPGAARALLGVPAAVLTDRVIRLAELPGAAADLTDELLELGPDEIFPFLENALPQRISEDRTQHAHRTLLRSAIAEISTGRSVPESATALAVSERQLRNLFTTGVGLSPKHFARIARVRRVLSQAGSTPWAQLAATTGYYDQSHLVADFRSLMGVAPTAFLRGTVPAPTPCRPLHHL